MFGNIKYLAAFRFLGSSVLAFTMACNATNPTVGSCTSASINEELIAPAPKYKVADLIIEQKESKQICNAFVDLVWAGDKYIATIYSAKHCVNPWDIQTYSLRLISPSGQVPTTIKAPLLDKMIKFSRVINAQIDKLDVQGSMDFWKLYSPSEVKYRLFSDAKEITSSQKSILENHDKIIADEVAKYGGSICDAGIKSTIESRACFTISDLFAFKAEIYVDPKYVNSINMQLEVDAKNYHRVDRTLQENIIERTSVEYGLFQLDVWDNVRQCYEEYRSNFMVLPESFKVCESPLKESLIALFKDPNFYIDNKDNFNALKSNKLENPVYISLATKYQSSSAKIISELDRLSTFSDIRILNKSTTYRGNTVPTLTKYRAVALNDFIAKPYGVIGSIDTSKMRIHEGDSGSILFHRGNPVAVLSTHNGNPVSSGLDIAIPEATAPVAIEIDSTGTATVGSPIMDKIASDPDPTIPTSPPTSETIVEIDRASSAENCL